jgi:hypothetical protein
MTKLACLLQLVTSRVLVHVVTVEVISDGSAEIFYPSERTLCGQLVRGELEDRDVSEATCGRCTTRADRLIEES